MDSLKKELINSIQSIPLVESCQDNVVTVVTAAGVIIGTPLSQDEDADNFMAQFVEKTAGYYRKDHSLDDTQPLDGNDGCFILKDVKLLAGNSTYNFNVLTIFFDQVIAITVGKMN